MNTELNTMKARLQSALNYLEIAKQALLDAQQIGMALHRAQTLSPMSRYWADEAHAATNYTDDASTELNRILEEIEEHTDEEGGAE